jgi:hypothetical protein
MKRRGSWRPDRAVGKAGGWTADEAGGQTAGEAARAGREGTRRLKDGPAAGRRQAARSGGRCDAFSLG